MRDLRRLARRACLALPALTACAAPDVPAAVDAPVAAVSLQSLLVEMTDRGAVARWPDPAFVCREASSTDPATVAPDRPGWYANDDRNHYVRDDVVAGRIEHVLLDEHGPGAIVRVWATWAGAGERPFPNGTLRIYLDGGAEPVLQGPIADIVGGDALVGAPLSQSVPPGAAPDVRGHDLYLPIPFASGCRITYETPRDAGTGAPLGEALYWSVTYRLYEAGTRVESFSMQELADAAAQLRATQAALVAGVAAGYGPGDAQVFSGTLEPDQEVDLSFAGPGALRHIGLHLTADDEAQALRSLVLELVFDDELTAWCPLDAFFGTGWLGSPLSTWFTRNGPSEGLEAVWVMPFERTARVRLRNLGQQPVEVTGMVQRGPWTWDERSLHFHATWHELHRVPTQTGPETDDLGAFDARFVAVEGRGVYVGDTLTVFNGAAAWWGEGDEKVFVDGEGFPSHLGTGTEDYYGYAWCRPEPFSAPFHAQPLGAGNFTPGLSVCGRWRALDAIPFRSSLRFDMELWHWARTRVNWAPATFWYARPGARCDIAPEPDAARRPVARTRGDVVEVLHVPGVLEGETLAVLAETGGRHTVQDDAAFGWSDGQQLWWMDARPGERLELDVPCARAGRFRVHMRLTSAPDYGIVRLVLAGHELAAALDLYHESVAVDELDLGVLELHAGGNLLVVEMVGGNPRAEPRHMFGLDFLRLDPAQD